MNFSDQTIIGLSFFVFLGFMVVVGLYSSTQSKNNTEDYLLASRAVNPLVTAISAVSSLLSGFMFIAFIGFAYVRGLSAIYYPLGWIAGDFVSWFFIHKKLREKSQEEGTNTITSFIGTFNKKRNELIIKFSSFTKILFSF